MRLHDHATNQPRTVANNFQIALLDTVPGVSSFAFTIFNDIFDNCRFIIDNTLSIMKLAGQTIYTHIYIYHSFVRSIEFSRSFIDSNSRIERIHTYRSFTRKKKQLPIDSTSDPFERSSSFSNEIFDHSPLHTFQTSPIQKLNRAFFPIFTSNVDAPFEINFEYPTSVRNRELKNNNKKKKKQSKYFEIHDRFVRDVK